MLENLGFIEHAHLNIQKSVRKYFERKEGGEVLCYSGAVLNRRIRQILIRDFYRELISDPSSKNISNCLKASIYKRLANFFRFLAYSLYYCFQLAKSILGNKKSASKKEYTFLLHPSLSDFIFENVEDEFEKWCETEAPDPLKLNGSRVILVQDKFLGRATGKIQFSKNFYIDLLSKEKFLWKDFLFYLKSLVEVFFVLLKTLFSRISFYGELNTLWKDFALHPLIMTLNNKKIISDYIITNSSFYDQEIWLDCWNGRNFKTHMVWYSCNSIPFHFKDQEVPVAEHPACYEIIADYSWTWSLSHKEWLEKNTSVKSVKLVKPILYHRIQAHIQDKKKWDIVIYDVTPLKKSYINRVIHEQLYYYYEANRMKYFLTSILNVVAELENEMGKKLSVGLKHKRKTVDLHDNNYLSLVSKLSDQGIIDLIEERKSIYNIISSTRVSLVCPFSSPAIVSEFLGGKSCYFDMNNILDPCERPEKNIPLFQDNDSLKCWIRENLNDNNL